MIASGLTEQIITKAYADRCSAIYALEEATRDDAYHLYRATLRRVWALAGHGKHFDTHMRAMYRRMARTRYTTSVYDARERAKAAVWQASQLRQRLLDLLDDSHAIGYTGLIDR